MATGETREVFENKIFFCDVIGFSKLDPVAQFSCQQSLNAVLKSVLQEIGARLEEDVIALPTGDGVVLNFLAPAPDIHLQTALGVLETFHSRDMPGDGRFEMRIGLNSDVDTCVRDINGKRNIVGRGINMAQRVMDLSRHGQILMHDQVRMKLENFPAHREFLVPIGNFTVKHGAQLPISQYVDPARPFLSQEIATPPAPAPLAALNLSDILDHQRSARLLTLKLDAGAQDAVPLIQDFVEDHLASLPGFESTKIAAMWIVGEMLDNVFAHADLSSSGWVELRIEDGRNGMSISVDQPDVPGFDLRRVLVDPEKSASFMQMMKDAGLHWTAPRIDGRLAISVTLPHGFRQAAAQRSVPGGPWEGDVFAPLGMDAPQALAASYVGRVDDTTCGAFTDFVVAKAREARDSARTLALDLGAVDYMSSQGLRALMLAHREAGPAGMVLTGVGDRLAEILAISRYDRIFRIERA